MKVNGYVLMRNNPLQFYSGTVDLPDCSTTTMRCNYPNDAMFFTDLDTAEKNTAELNRFALIWRPIPWERDLGEGSVYTWEELTDLL